MTFSVKELMEITSLGGVLALDARSYSVTDLQALVAHAKKKCARITIKSSWTLRFADVKALAKLSGNAALFDLS